jgi:copper(I)-binding protein
MKNRDVMQTVQQGLRVGVLALMGWVLSLTVALAQEAKLGALAIQGAYIKPMVAGQSNAVGYLKISNAGSDDKLLSASASGVGTIQLHFMGMQGDVMKMNEVAAVDLPAGKTVELKPGSYHLMLMGVKAPVKEGDRVKVRLKFEKAGELELDFPVTNPGMSMGHHDHMAH